MTFLQSIKARDPACRNALEAALLYPGVHAVFWHRVAHFLHKIHLKFLAALVAGFCRFFTGIEIHPGATIGKRLFIDHGSGVVVGETAVIGDDCTFYQGVTLGGTGKETGKRHPTIGNGVLIGSGAILLGSIRVGDGAKIAAGAVVLDHVPDHATAVGVPARMVADSVRDGEADWRSTPDPLSQELCRLQVSLERMERRLAELEGVSLQKSVS